METWYGTLCSASKTGVIDKGQKRNATIFVAVLAIYALDFAINALQSSCRSLIVDTLSVPKQQIGSAWGRYWLFLRMNPMC